MHESQTRLIPYGKAEVAWANHRPPEHRTPIPAVGDVVLYRHDPWGAVTEAEVLAVQDDDGTIRYGDWSMHEPRTLRTVAQDEGRPLMLDGAPIVIPLADPWPLLILSTNWGRALAQEARLRGSAGWLPPDWEARFRPVPDFVDLGSAATPVGPHRMPLPPA